MLLLRTMYTPRCTNLKFKILFEEDPPVTRDAKQGGGGGGVSTPPEFWMGGLNTCQPP